jgi:sugar O-acyltransferase (sialic acid O-acetyltransferase NeuD family)
MDATNGSAIQDSKSAGHRRTGRTALALRSLPPDCQRILIVGAGGFGREVLQWARDAWPESEDRIAGFLSTEPNALEGFDCNHSVLGSPDAYRPAPGDRFLLAIGIPYVRRRVAESLLAHGAEFVTLIHPTAIVAATASIGPGSILCPYSIASDSCRVGRFVIMNYHSSLGHDASAGDFSVLSPYATLGGHAHVEDDVFLGLHASVGPGKTVGARSKVSANSCVLATAPADSIVYGVPGRIARRVETASTVR